MSSDKPYLIICNHTNSCVEFQEQGVHCGKHCDDGESSWQASTVNQAELIKHIHMATFENHEVRIFDKDRKEVVTHE